MGLGIKISNHRYYFFSTQTYTFKNYNAFFKAKTFVGAFVGAFIYSHFLSKFGEN